MNVKGLVEHAIFTTVFAAHLEVYSHILGEPIRTDEAHIAEFTSGSETIRIHRTPETVQFAAPNEDHVAYAVDDLEKSYEQLVARGVNVVAPPQEYPWGRSMYLRDPDGRLIELHEE